MSFKSRALFIQIGQFSGTNAALHNSLRLQYDDLEIEVLDIRKRLLQRKTKLFHMIVLSLFEYGLPKSDLRKSLRNNFYRSKVFFEVAADMVQEQTLKGGYAFSFQTQSIIDGSTRDLPHFVYTDHADLGLRDKRSVGENVSTARKAWLARERRIYERANHVFTFGPRVRRMIIEQCGLSKEKISVVASGVQAEAGGPVDTRIERYRQKRILFVGQDWDRKGGPELLTAFAKLRSIIPDAHLDIVGTSIPKEALGVSVLGLLPPAEVAAQFAKASCFCLPSRLEPFGIAVAEAMHHGLPVVSTQVGDISSMVEDGVNGYLVPSRDPDALADALVRLVSDAELSAKFGSRGLQKAKGFTWENVVQKMSRHFRISGQ